MHLSFILPAVLATVVSAQTLTLAQAINSQNVTLSTLNGLLAQNPTLLNSLAGATNITLLAPSNAAFNKFLSTPGGQMVASDSTLTQGLLQYHVLGQTIPGSGFTGTSQFIKTLLTDNRFTNVTGGQVVEGVSRNGKVLILSGLKEVSIVQTADIAFTGGVMHIIDTVLTVPLNPSFTAIDSNLTALAGALTATNLVSTVDSLKDITIVAPSNAAFQAIGSATSSLTPAQLRQILTYHVITQGVAYSNVLTTTLANQSLTTADNVNVKTLFEDGKVFVNGAQVVITDIIVSNGVMHVIDNVLNPANLTAVPDPRATPQPVAFAGAGGAPNVPFTSGIIPTTTAPSASTKTAMAVRKEGKIGVAALFGAGVVGMAIL